MTAEEIRHKILAGLPEAEVDVQGDDGVHFQAVIVSERFRGLSRVQQHKLIYQILGNAFDGALHALALTTRVPEG
ncbi:BolA family transcriptional regulator [bacterium CPR1]|nr:BolA family transcriptional regulator [bacterium CPR1]